MVKTVANNQFMYGSSIMVSIRERGFGTYFPQGMYATPSYIYYHFKIIGGIFYSEGKTSAEVNQYYFLTQGSITPLQDPYGTHENLKIVNNTADLI
jgi:hypothetical protein